ncbi:MAG: hypothetical protein AAGH46_07385 [Bacteroidota bacterium]
MIKENRTTKYLLYAIGEIILVVIGILIALQVNTWKEEKNDRLLEQKILKGLLVEFENAQYELELDSIARNSIFNSINYFINIKNGTIPFPETFDTIASSIESVKRYRFYTPSHPQLKDLQSSGRFDLIASKETREALLDYIEWWDRVSTLENNTQNAVIANLRPYLAENCDLSLIDSKNPEQQLQFVSQIKTMTQKTNFGSMLRLRLEDLYPIIFYSENLMLSIKNCQEQISKDLNTYNK